MAHTHANGINLHYWQTGEGPNLIMIHGLTGNLAVWHFTLLPKLRHDYQIAMYDLRGHGRSDMPPTGYTTEDMAQDLRCLMDELKIEKAHLIGHSLGADIALHFAILYPERVEKIVAMEAGTAALVHLRKDSDWAGWQEWAKGLEKYGNVQVPREKWHDIDYMLRRSLEMPIVFGPARGLPRKKERILQLLDTTTLVDDYQRVNGMTLEAITQIQQPVLLIYGTQSTYLGTYEILINLLPNNRQLLVEGGEHFSVLEQAAGLAEPIHRFLQEDYV